MKAYRHLVRHALSQNCTVSVWDGEEWEVKRSKSFKAIVDAIESVEEAQLRIRDIDANYKGWAMVSASGLEPEETVIDFSDNEFMNEWDNLYLQIA